MVIQLAHFAEKRRRPNDASLDTRARVIVDPDEVQIMFIGTRARLGRADEPEKEVIQQEVTHSRSGTVRHSSGIAGLHIPRGVSETNP